jgi:2-polyprenyl-3-methyl-5-hydroxy-6-metoxy-1,4-benzoquinol methylase
LEPGLAEAYAELHSRHWWWRARERFLQDQIRRRGLCDGRRILDVGCAAGHFLSTLHDCGEVYGLEPDPGLRDQAGAWRERIHPGPFDASFEPGHRFGLILMLDVLEHIEDPVSALRRALALLEPDGTLLITVPAFQFLWTRHDEINRHFLRYDRASFRELAGAAGLAVRDLRYFFHWLVAPKLVVRGLEAIKGGAARPPRIPPPWLNRGLYLASRAEQGLTDRLHVPWGTSLLAVGGHPGR